MNQVEYDHTVFLSKSLKFPKEWRNKDDIAKGESSKPKTRTPAKDRDIVSECYKIRNWLTMTRLSQCRTGSGKQNKTTPPQVRQNHDSTATGSLESLAWIAVNWSCYTTPSFRSQPDLGWLKRGREHCRRSVPRRAPDARDVKIRKSAWQWL